MPAVIDGTNNSTFPGVDGVSMLQGSVAMPRMVLSTAQNTTSGTSIDFTSIPSWVKRITLLFAGVSTNGTNAWLVQVGAGSITTSGYVCSGANITSTGANNTNYTNGFGFAIATATALASGTLVLNAFGNTWLANGQLGRSDSAVTNFTSGQIAIGGALDRLRLTTVGGTDTFDAGSVNLLLEG